MQVPRRTEKKEGKKGINILELKIVEKIKLLNGACMEAEIKDNLPVMSGKIGNKNVEVLRDNGCNGENVKKDLADEVTFTGKVGLHDDGRWNANMNSHCQDRSRQAIQTAYIRTFEAMCMKDPLLDLIIWNVPIARNPNDPNP